MDPNSAMPAERGDGATPLFPPFEPILEFKRIQLRPIWVGIVLTVGGFLLFAFAAQSADEATARSIAFLCSFPAFIYYLMVVHRLVRVLDLQPGWSVEYTPAAAVWKHFIPFYGLYFLYQWPRDVESYISWRLNKESRVGLWTFFGLIAGFLLRLFDSFLGLFLVLISLYILYVPLRRALETQPPANEPAPGYNGTLGLR